MNEAESYLRQAEKYRLQDKKKYNQYLTDEEKQLLKQIQQEITKRGHVLKNIQNFIPKQGDHDYDEWFNSFKPFVQKLQKSGYQHVMKPQMTPIIKDDLRTLQIQRKKQLINKQRQKTKTMENWSALAKLNMGMLV
jgi:hypothetical protein